MMLNFSFTRGDCMDGMDSRARLGKGLSSISLGLIGVNLFFMALGIVRLV